MRFHPSGDLLTKSATTIAGVASLWITSCLDAAPVYEEQQRIPPFLLVPSTQPRVDAVAEVATNRTLQIRVPFRSDDLGEELTAQFALNSEVLGRDQIGPSVFEDDTRAAEFTFQPEVDPGCYQLRMVLTYFDNLPELSVLDETQAAYLYWWVNVFDPRTGVVAPCPGEGE